MKFFNTRILGTLAGLVVGILGFGAGVSAPGAEDDAAFLGRWPIAHRGSVYRIATAEPYLYISSIWEGGIIILDATDPIAPKRVGSIDWEGSAGEAAVAGRYLCVAQELWVEDSPGSRGLGIIDTADPAHPRQVGFAATGEAQVVAVSGNRAYVRGGFDPGGNLYAVDISNPSEPHILGAISCPGSGLDLEVSGGLAFVAEGEWGLHILDVSNPASIRRVYGDAFSSYGAPAKGLALLGAYVCVAHGGGGLAIYDVTMPSMPQIIGRYTNVADAAAIVVSGDRAYLVDRPSFGAPESENRLQILDLSDPAQPRVLGIHAIPNPGPSMGLAVSGGYAYLAQGNLGIGIVRVTPPSNPEAVGRVETAGEAHDVAVAGSYAVLADGENGVQILDVSRPESPEQAARLPFAPPGYAVSVALEGSIGYVAAGEQGVQVIDLTHPAQPRWLGNADTPGWARSVAPMGTLVCVADHHESLQVIDTTLPDQPRRISAFDTGGASAVAVAGHHALVASWDGNLQVIDLKDPGNPARAAVYRTPMPVQDVVVQGTHAYLADGDSGLIILDVANPATPRWQATLDLEEWAFALAVVGAQAYVLTQSPDFGFATMWNQLQVINIASPTTPRRIQIHPRCARNGVAASGDLAFLALGTRGMQILRIGLSETNPPVTITRHPQDQDIVLGGTATLRVEATGPEPLTYQWIKDDSVVVPGATGDTLVLSPAVPGDAGVYQAMVSSPAGFTRSQPAWVTVSPPPGTLHLTVRALIDGLDQLIIHGNQLQWHHLQNAAPGRHEGRDLPTELTLVTEAGETQRIPWIPGWPEPAPAEIRSEAFSSELTNALPFLPDEPRIGMLLPRQSRGAVRIVQQPVSTNDFTLILEFDDNLWGGSDFYEVTLVMVVPQDPPVLTAQPQDQEAVAGSSATFTLTATGSRPLAYRWQRDTGVELPSTHASLVLNSVQSSDAGGYWAVITNAYGAVTSRVAQLTVTQTARPRVVAARTAADPSRVTVSYSRAMDPVSAGDPANYTLSDGSPVTRVDVLSPETVLLHTALAAPGWLTLEVQRVRAADLEGLSVPAHSRIVFPLTDGGVQWGLYDRVPPGTPLDAALQNPSYLSGWPSRSGLFTAFEFPTDDHGAQLLGQLRAFVHPPVSGTYRFWLWGDDTARLFLSPGDDPARKREIARVDTRADFRSYPVASDPVELRVGTRYYLEAVFLESDDLDGVGVAWQLPGAPPLVPGDPPIPGEFLSTLARLPGAPAFNRAAVALDAIVGQPLEFRLSPTDLGGSPPFALQWGWGRTVLMPEPGPGPTGTIFMPVFMTDAIPGATHFTLNLPWVEPVQPEAPQQATLSLRVTNAYGSLGDSPPGVPSFGVPIAELRLVPDPLPPAVEWVEATDQGDAIRVRFSEAVTTSSAGLLSNFRLFGGPTLLSAARQPDGRTVLLATSAQTFGTTLELTVRDVTDREGHPMAAEQRFTFPTPVEQAGVIARELWQAAPLGQHLATLTELPAFQAGEPASRQRWPGAETPADVLDHYGQRLWGWIVPPDTGAYRFAIAADETAGLYLSQGEWRENLERVAWVEHRTGVREWTRYPAQISEPRILEAGKAYAFEALMSEGVGVDHLSLGWIRPGASAPEVIDAGALRLRFDPRGLGPILIEPPVPLTAWQQTGGAFHVRAVAGAFALGPLQFQWQRNGTDLPGATSDTLLLPVPLEVNVDDGARYRCAVTDAMGSRVVSAEATLTVRPQAEAARLTIAQENGKIVVRWPEEAGVTLQRATRLQRPDWADVPTAGGIYETPASETAALFRLMRR